MCGAWDIILCNAFLTRWSTSKSWTKEADHKGEKKKRNRYHFTQSVVMRKKKDFALKCFKSCAGLVMIAEEFLIFTESRHRLTAVR
ncbi:hypothetical protein NQZ68_040880 [Dissostichus eleginoides]|nr:hypothetical protein NQZ68_040880 [Dissostichus eleginoides]